MQNASWKIGLVLLHQQLLQTTCKLKLIVCVNTHTCQLPSCNLSSSTISHTILSIQIFSFYTGILQNIIKLVLNSWMSTSIMISVFLFIGFFFFLVTYNNDSQASINYIKNSIKISTIFVMKIDINILAQLHALCGYLIQVVDI